MKKRVGQLQLHHYPHHPHHREVPLCLGALGGAIKVHLDEGITAGTHHTSAIGLPNGISLWRYLNHQGGI